MNNDLNFDNLTFSTASDNVCDLCGRSHGESFDHGNDVVICMDCAVDSQTIIQRRWSDAADMRSAEGLIREYDEAQKRLRRATSR